MKKEQRKQKRKKDKKKKKEKNTITQQKTTATRRNRDVTNNLPHLVQRHYRNACNYVRASYDASNISTLCSPELKTPIDRSNHIDPKHQIHTKTKCGCV